MLPENSVQAQNRDLLINACLLQEGMEYQGLLAWFAEQALWLPARRLAYALYNLPIAPYAPIRRQLLTILREVNRIRKQAGKPALPTEVLPLRRRPVKPFEPSEQPPPRRRDGPSNPSIAGG